MKRCKPKFRVGQVVASTQCPDWRPEYGRVQESSPGICTVRLYDAEQGDFYDSQGSDSEWRPLTRKEKG